MLRWIYGRSTSAALGRTENCSISSGHSPPTRIADSTSSAAAIAGILKSRKKIAVKNDTAHNTAIATSTSLAGSSAWISV
ncbi:Uncharacterised protein [Mycobacterium tuberculosis]|uniref:Uncharacterized protein n=1 Tax=Mycobacterium tuberculosis TaxID=1773 RepID=A0A0T7PI68_MYCTX|nr:Uncharacterised protein [Mycobacterium tuberculosis]CFB18952.1 Uncharacterised protein [Mycobacterium tuberculosis]CFC60736.1 Uncharacterised protein [Mycobacterium tuberculosis]CFE79477.1 Uncharacterised protein [Mycobacterium tuberculosis]CFG91340.1 Uncharacterised protein [Mycobacterium tuberculosis]